MSETTKIEWCNHTASPWYGCEHAKLQDGSDHPGCANCYAEALSKRNPATLGEWGASGKRVVSKSFHANCRKWNAAAAKAGVRQSVFPSLCDPFEDWQGHMHDSHGDRLQHDEGSHSAVYGDRFIRMADCRTDLFATIDNCPWLDFLLLTKRPENIRKMWTVANGESPYLLRKNVQLLYSASDQQSLEAGIGELLKCRDLVPVLGLSLEPLVGPITFRWAPWHESPKPENHLDGLRQLDWIIVGGESGSHCRPCDVSWIKEIVSQCREANVPCFVKQLGGLVHDKSRACMWPVGTEANGLMIYPKDKKGGDWNEFPADLRVRQFPVDV